MKIGISIPRLPDSVAIRRFVQRAEQLGFESVLAGDHVVLPTGGTNQYPYTADGSFQRPSDEPFLETMTLLGYMVACSETIKLGKPGVGAAAGRQLATATAAIRAVHSPRIRMPLRPMPNRCNTAAEAPTAKAGNPP